MEKCKITAELAQRAADLQKLDATEYKPTVGEAMEVEQPPPENLTEDQENFWIEKQAEANAAKRALRTPLPSVGAQQRLSHPKKLMLSLQILPKALPREVGSA